MAPGGLPGGWHASAHGGAVWPGWGWGGARTVSRGRARQKHVLRRAAGMLLPGATDVAAAADARTAPAVARGPIRRSMAPGE